jgi:hypothetical protein
MIFEGYDGLNCTLKLSPRTLKVVFEILKRPNVEQILAATDSLKKAGFVTTPDDIVATVRQAAMSLQGMADNIVHVTQEDLERQAAAARNAAADPDEQLPNKPTYKN